MIIYLSDDKVNNLLEEMSYTKKCNFFSLGKIKFNSHLIETELKMNDFKENLGGNLKQIVKYLKKSKLLRDVTLNESLYREFTYYRCTGIIRQDKLTDKETGIAVDSFSDFSKMDLLDLEIEINNRFFNKLIVTCSIRNLRIFKFYPNGFVTPNSLASVLWRRETPIPVETIFLMSSIDRLNGVVYGSPIIINF